MIDRKNARRRAMSPPSGGGRRSPVLSRQITDGRLRRAGDAARRPPPYGGGMAFTRTPTLRDQRGDLLLALVLFVGAILSAALSSIAQVNGDEQAPLWTALVYAVVVAAPLGFRRRWPGTVAVVVSLAYFTAVTIRVPEIYVGNIAMFIALYTVGAWMNVPPASTTSHSS
ncbi:unnamed protein product [Penicillium discolor]